MKKSMFVFMCALSASCFGWLGWGDSDVSPARLQTEFARNQISDPFNPVNTYNLGIAAQQQEKPEEAKKHFSLAADLCDAHSPHSVPIHFSWADVAAVQLITALRSEKELKDAALEKAIGYASEAGTQYGQVLERDDVHAQARERKKIVDRLRAILEQRKKQQEEEKKQKEEEKKEKDEQKKNQDKEKNQDQKNDQDKQDGQDQESDSDDKNSGKDQKEGQGNQDGKDQKSGKDQKKDRSDKNEKAPENKDEQDHKSEEHEGNPADLEPKKEEEDSASPADQAEKDQQAGGGEDQLGDDQKENDKKDASSPASAAEEGGDKEEGAEEPAAPVAAQPAPQYDANAEMAKKRGLVLLDKLQQNEAALQKEQLLKKSALQQKENIRYNQW